MRGKFASLVIGVSTVLSSHTTWGEMSGNAQTTEALSTSLLWMSVYLGIGALLVAVAVATGLREHRAWSALLRWENAGREDEAETREETRVDDERAGRAA